MMFSYIILIFLAFACLFKSISSHYFVESGNDGVATRFDFMTKLTAGKERKLVVKALRWQNCGSANDPWKLHKLAFRHTPLGDFLLTVKTSMATNVKPPISAKVKVKYSHFGSYFDVPCIRKMIGSCSFKDLCKYSLPECPFKAMRDAGVPCQCPIPQGSISIIEKEFPMPSTRFANSMAGSYMVNLKFFSGRRQLACYAANVTLA